MAKLNPQERLEFDLSLKSDAVFGIDEVGWGCIAGGLVLGGCLIKLSDYLEMQKKSNPLLSIIRDSKKVTALNRDKIVKGLSTLPVSTFTGHASVEEINQVGLAEAYNLALQRLLSQVDLNKTLIILDGSRVPSLLKSYQCQLIIKGDDKSLAIGIASVVAKECRDQLMKEAHNTYPLYGFDSHKGYGTADHVKALKDHGITPLHRIKGTTTILS